MEEIRYMEKPDWVSWEDVLSCLHEAHKVNKRYGFTMPGFDLTMEEFKEKLGVPDKYEVYTALIIGVEKERSVDGVSGATTREPLEKKVAFVK